MSKNELHFEEKKVTIAGQVWETEYPISEAKVIDNRVLLIFDPMAGPSWCQFQNLKAFDLEGNELWTAQHPTTSTNDCYIDFMKEEDSDSFTAWNFACFICRIDIETGKLTETTFTK